MSTLVERIRQLWPWGAAPIDRLDGGPPQQEAAVEAEIRRTDDANVWHRIWYDQAQSDIRWAKERGWTVMYATAVLIGAIYAAHGKLPEVPIGVPMLAILLASSISIGWLASLNAFAGKARAYVDHRLNRVKKMLPLVDDEAYPFGRGGDPDHHRIFLSQGCLIASFGASTWYSLCLQQGFYPGHFGWAGVVILLSSPFGWRRWLLRELGRHKKLLPALERPDAATAPNG